MRMVQITSTSFSDDGSVLLVRVGGQFQCGGFCLLHDVDRNDLNEVVRVTVRVEPPPPGSFNTQALVPVDETFEIPGPFASEVEIHSPAGQVNRLRP